MVIFTNKVCILQPPIDTINFEECITTQIGPVNRDICARLNTVLVETQRQSRSSDKDSLVVVCQGDKTILRYACIAFYVAQNNFKTTQKTRDTYIYLFLTLQTFTVGRFKRGTSRVVYNAQQSAVRAEDVKIETI